MGVDRIWVNRCTTILHNASLDGRLDHVFDCILLRHLFSILSGLIGGPDLDLTLQHDLLFLTFKLLLSLRRADLNFPLVDLVLLMLLSQLSLHLFEHFLLNHASKSILHGIACRFESTEPSTWLGLLLFKLALNLRVEQNLDEALGRAIYLLIHQFLRLNVFFIWWIVGDFLSDLVDLPLLWFESLTRSDIAILDHSALVREGWSLVLLTTEKTQ